MADSLVETPASSSSHLINLGMNQLPVDLQAGSSSGGSSSSSAASVVASSSSSSAPAPSSSSSGGQTSTLLISVATQPTHGLNLSEQIMTPAGQPQEQLNLTLQQPQSQSAEVKDSGKSGRSADRSGEDEPEVKRKKIDKSSTTKMIEKLEARLGGILCCAVCLDLPRTAMYQVNLSIHHLFLPISHPKTPLQNCSKNPPLSRPHPSLPPADNPRRGPKFGSS